MRKPQDFSEYVLAVVHVRNFTFIIRIPDSLVAAPKTANLQELRVFSHERCAKRMMIVRGFFKNSD